MTIERPDAAEIGAIARELGYRASAAHADEFVEIVTGMLGAYDVLDDEGSEPSTRPAVRYTQQDDATNAWFLRTELRERDHGPLAGYRLAVKDNVMVAGLPMSAGSRLLDGYQASFDATVVARALDAGATIVGKTNCEYFCLDGNSYTSDYGVVRNPHAHERSSGGSSSGNAVALASNEADLAIGTDQAGSIRVPASYCGVVGLKPTHGLVPYTGALGLDPVIDHAGPMARTVADVALLLGVLAGYDSFDERQRDVRVQDYAGALRAGVRGLRIGVLAEGFGQDGSEPEVDATVGAAAGAFTALDAEVREVSIPDHANGLAYWTPLVLHGMAHTVVAGQAFGVGRRERYPIDLMTQLLGVRDRVDELPSTVTACAITAEYVRRRYGVTYYARGINAIRRLAAQYDEALQSVDVLIMPTTPHRATPLPDESTTLGDYVAGANDMFGNTAVFNATGHPALSVPCGAVDGLPVGMMIVGRHFDEATVLRAGDAVAS